MRSASRPGGTALRITLLTALALTAAGCSSLGGGLSAPTAPTAQRSFSDRMSDTLFGGPPPATTASAVRPDDDDFECPVADIRAGASTLTMYGPGDQTATNVRYQGTISDYARECRLAGPTLNMKVGIRGRLVLGPAGGQGTLDVPLRIALVQEGAAPKTIWTKLYKVTVVVPPDQTNVPFSYVEDSISVPKPSAADVASYVVYVGFDQQAMSERSRPQRAPRQSRRAPPR